MAYEQKICDFDKIERTGMKEIVPIDEKKILSLSFRCFKNPKTGVWYGIPEEFNPQTGHYTFKRLTITGRRMFYLENEEDAKEFYCWSQHPSMLGSPHQSGKPFIKLYDRVSEAEKSLKKMDMSIEAIQIARTKLSGEELIDFARILGITPEANDDLVIKQLVAEKAQRNPEEFLRKYTDSNREIYTVIKRAIAVGIITDSLDSGLVYGGSHVLGTSEVTAVAHLRDHGDLLNTINVESKTEYKRKFGKEEILIDEPKTETEEVVDAEEQEALINEPANDSDITEEDAAMLGKTGTDDSHVTEAQLEEE